MNVVLRAIAGSIAALVLCGSARADDAYRSKLAGLVKQGDELMERAFTMARDKPQSSMQAGFIAMSIGHRWTVDEHRFQADLTAMGDKISGRSMPDVQEGLVRLGQFDEFAANGVGALYDCQMRQAHWNLKVAAQFLRHAHLALDGQARPEWSPDLDAAPEGGLGCS